MDKLIDLTKHPRYAKPRLLLPNRPKCEVIEASFTKTEEEQGDQKCPFCNMESYNEETRRWVMIAKREYEEMELIRRDYLKYLEQDIQNLKKRVGKLANSKPS